MTSKRETVLAALFSALQGVADAAVYRNESLGLRVPPAAGLVILFDGDPGEPEVLLSPLTYIYTHQAELDVIVTADEFKEGRLDEICGQVAAVLDADRTLGGLCDWIEASAPAPTEISIEAGATVHAAALTLTLIYATTNPLT